MEIGQGTFFKYAFFIDYGDTDAVKNQEDSEIFNWCTENITGQWITMSNSSNFSRLKTGFTYHSRASHKSPIVGHDYPPAQIHATPEKIYIFENEDDAAAFKLRWME